MSDCWTGVKGRVDWNEEREGGEAEGESLLGITKSGTSAKGEMRLVPKPNGTWGGLRWNGIISGKFCTMGAMEGGVSSFGKSHLVGNGQRTHYIHSDKTDPLRPYTAPSYQSKSRYHSSARWRSTSPGTRSYFRPLVSAWNWGSCPRTPIEPVTESIIYFSSRHKKGERVHEGRLPKVRGR